MKLNLWNITIAALKQNMTQQTAVYPMETVRFTLQQQT